MNERREAKRKSKNPKKKYAEDSGVIDDDFSEEYIKHSGSISTKQATELDIGIVEVTKKSELGEKGNAGSRMDVDIGGFILENPEDDMMDED